MGRFVFFRLVRRAITITVYEYALTLVRIILFCLIDYKNAPFTQFVQSAYGLTDKVLTAVVYAIGFDGNDYGKELGHRLGLDIMEDSVIMRVINFVSVLTVP